MLYVSPRADAAGTVKAGPRNQSELTLITSFLYLESLDLILRLARRNRVEIKNVQLGADQIVLAPEGVEHGVRNESQARLVVLVFMAPNPNKAEIGQ
jgi:hypothetical protein